MSIKEYYMMTDEEILEEAIKAIPAYLEILGKEGEFSMEACLKRCIGRVKELYKRSAGRLLWQQGTTSSRTLTQEDVDELTRICVRLDAPLRERIETVQKRFLKKRAVFRINRTTAASLIPAAFKEVGLKADVTGQQYRAKVEVSLPSGNALRFYVSYKNLTKDGVLDGVVKAVTDLNDALSRLGGQASIKKG